MGRINKRINTYDEFVNEQLTAKQKKLPQALQDAILKKQGETPKKDEKVDDKGCKCKKGDCKCDDKKEDEKPNGLSAKQKKLPQGLQDAIIKKQNQKK